jgi:adenylosuccinate lyase
MSGLAGSSPFCVFEWRYGSPEMRQILSRDSLVDAMKRVEIALAEALEEAGVAPPGVAERIRRAAEEVTAEEVYRLEKEKTGHDVAALVELIAARAGGEAARWVHYGATSNDIVDTAWALVLRDALALLRSRLAETIARLSRLAEETINVVMAGRTHGQHALPVTLGFKRYNYCLVLKNQ